MLMNSGAEEGGGGPLPPPHKNRSSRTPNSFLLLAVFCILIPHLFLPPDGFRPSAPPSYTCVLFFLSSPPPPHTLWPRPGVYEATTRDITCSGMFGKFRPRAGRVPATRHVLLGFRIGGYLKQCHQSVPLLLSLKWDFDNPPVHTCHISSVSVLNL